MIKYIVNLFLAFIEFVEPPDRWKLPVIISLGLITGSSFYVFYISNAISYISDSPKTCINCHVMTTQFVTWDHSSHRERATCNDCHVPHDTFIKKYYFKMMDGLKHSTYFTFHWEPEAIKIKGSGSNVVHENCIRCHENLLRKTKLITSNIKDAESNRCWRCHRQTPHERPRSLSSAPSAIIPVWYRKK